MEHGERKTYWQALDELVASSEVIIDRPKGTAHPRYGDFIYPYDYGYLQGTSAADSGGIDVWVGSQEASHVTAIIVCVDLLKRDSEIKILLGCTHLEMEHILALQNDGKQSALLVTREV